MKKNVVKLDENSLRQIVAESVKRVLKESNDGQNYPYYDAKNAQDAIRSAAEAFLATFKGDPYILPPDELSLAIAHTILTMSAKREGMI